MSFNSKNYESGCSEEVLVMLSGKKAKYDGPQGIYPVGKTVTYCWFGLIGSKCYRFQDCIRNKTEKML